MKEASGTGRIFRDLGPIERIDQDIAGEIGGSGQPSTLLILFRADAPFDLRVVRLAVQPFTDRFLSIGLRDQEGEAIPLSEQGEPLLGGNAQNRRLPPGAYAVSIATSQWQRSPFRLRLTVAALVSLRLGLRGQSALVGGFRVARLRAVCTGRGRLEPRPSGLRALRCRTVEQARLWGALVSIPTYEKDPAAGLPHAWLLESGNQLQVGSGDGSSWLTTELPVITSYIASGLSVADYRMGTQRLVFAQGAEDVYATYPDIGPGSSEVAQALSPDAPGRPFQAVVQGKYVRRCTFSLPVDGATQLLVVIREELRWNNDVIRDVSASNPAAPVYTATNARAGSAHQRLILLFVVTSSRIRPLRTVPPEFRSRLDVVLPPLRNMLRARRLQVPGDRYPRASVDCLVPDFALTGDAPSEGDRIFGADPSEPYGNLLISLGLTWSMQARQGFTSAAIYDLLRDYTTIRLQADYDRRSYSFALRNLVNRPPDLAHYSPFQAGGGYASSADGKPAYDREGSPRLRYGRWRGPLPSSAATPLEMSGDQWSAVNLEQVLSPSRLYVGGSPQVLVSHNWNLPRYCRLSLGELGFSSGDLRVNAPGGRARLLLNPAAEELFNSRGSLGGSRVIAQTTRRLSGALVTRGALEGSRVLAERPTVLRGRGSLSLSIATGAGLIPVLLGAALRGSGGLSGGALLSHPRAQLRGAIGMGRPVLFIYTRLALRTTQSGAGGFGTPRLISSTKLVLAIQATGRGRLGAPTLIIATLRVLATSARGRGGLGASSLVTALTRVLVISATGRGGLGTSSLVIATLRVLATAVRGRGGLGGSTLVSSTTRVLTVGITGRGGLGSASLTTTPTGATPPGADRLSIGLFPINRLFLFDPDD